MTADGKVDPMPWLRRAEQLMKQEQWFEALQLMEEALPFTEGKQKARVRLTMARVYLRNPRWTKDAETMLVQVIRNEPSNVEAHVLLAALYAHGRLKSRAMPLLEKALQLEPGNAVAERILGDLLTDAGSNVLREMFRKGQAGPAER